MGGSLKILMFYGLKIIPFTPDVQVNNAPTTTYKPQVVKNGRYLFIILFQLLPELRCGCFFIFSHRKDLEFLKSSI